MPDCLPNRVNTRRRGRWERRGVIDHSAVIELVGTAAVVSVGAGGDGARGYRRWLGIKRSAAPAVHGRALAEPVTPASCLCIMKSRATFLEADGRAESDCHLVMFVEVVEHAADAQRLVLRIGPVPA